MLWDIKKKLPKLNRLLKVSLYIPSPLTKSADNSPDVIVSLTSYGERLKTVDLAIRSIMDQTVRPNKIILYLDKSIQRKNLPRKLLRLEKYGLDIRFDCEDIKPHKKYYYAFNDYPKSLVITIDDDLIYARDTIESLLEGHARFPKSVIARRCHNITFTKDGNVALYNDWEFEYGGQQYESKKSLLVTNGGGVLFPVECFDLKSIELSAIKEQALYSDDIYLKFVELANNIDVVYVPNNLKHPYVIPNTQQDALFHRNVEMNKNDECFLRLMHYYHYSSDVFKDQK